MLQVGELDLDNGLDDAILGRDPGLYSGGAAVVLEQVVMHLMILGKYGLGSTVLSCG